MKIGIIGAGNMGSAFAKRLAAAGHEVSITAQDPSHAEQAASAAGGNVRAVPQDQIAAGADLLILATPYTAAAEALNGAGDVSGKTSSTSATRASRTSPACWSASPPQRRRRSRKRCRERGS